MRFIKKEDKERVELFNKLANMKHRTKPYDFNNADDIIEAVNMATGEYLDMYRYSCDLMNLDEAFDESMEYYYPESWINLTMPDGDVDEELLEASAALGDLIDSFNVLEGRAEEKCRNLWEIVLLSAPDKVRQHYFGDNIGINSEKAKEAIESAFETITIEVCDYNIQKSTANFAKHMKAILTENSD